MMIVYAVAHACCSMSHLRLKMSHALLIGTNRYNFKHAYMVAYFACFLISYLLTQYF